MKKGDATRWAYKTEAQIETGTYKRIKEAERVADIRICELLNIYYEKHLKIRSQDPLKEKYLIKMQEVVPPLNRGDFLNSWKEDRAQLEKVRKERDDAVKESKRLKGIMQTTWTKNWRSKVSEEEKK